MLGYLLAGLIVGPYLPVPVRVDVGLAHTLSEIGVILLMFSLGLEFSLRKLVPVAGTAGIVAAIECSLMVWLGYQTGHLFGWNNYESLFAGAMAPSPAPPSSCAPSASGRWAARSGRSSSASSSRT